MNPLAIFERHARLAPERIALIDVVRDRPRRLSYARLQQEIGRLAALFADHGLAPGDRVLLALPVGAELYVTLLALFHRGLTAVFIDRQLDWAEIRRRLEQLRPRAVIATRRALLLGALLPEVRRIPVKVALGRGLPGARHWNAAIGSAAAPAALESDAATPALITLTSGSTGRAKAAVRTLGLLAAQSEALQEVFPPAAGDVVLTALPLFVLVNLVMGITSVLPDADLSRPGTVDPRPIAAQIGRHRVSRIIAGPAFLGRLIDGLRNSGPAAGIADVFTGGGPVHPGLLEAAEAVWPGARIHVVYGATEAEPIAHAAASDLTLADRAAMRRGRGLLVGRPVAGIDCRILPDRQGLPRGACDRDRFAEDCRGAMQPGEIVVSGPHVLPGYLDDDANVQFKFTVAGTRWHRTGDAGYFDAGGRLWLLGRCSERSVAGGVPLYPFEVEVPAQALDGVRRAGFAAVAGKRILAVELDRSLTSEERLRISTRLARLPVDEVRRVESVPVDRRHNAKVDYPALKLRLANGLGAGLGLSSNPVPREVRR